MLKHVVISYIFVVVQVIYFSFSEKPNNYGEFTLKIIKFDICKGPKRIDCSNITASVQNETDLTLNIDITKDYIPNRGKIVSTINNKPLVRLQMKNPCDHLFMKPLFQAILNVSQDCQFKQGKHIIHINLEEIAKKYYGGMFLYGNITFKSIFYNDECNLSCAVVEVNFSPKKNINKT